MNTPEQIEQHRQELLSEDVSSFSLGFQNSRIFAKKMWISGSADLSNSPMLASVNKAYDRLQICEGCEFYRDSRCTKCGFVMKSRVHVEFAQCPINKWGGNLQVLLLPKQLINPTSFFTLRNDSGAALQYVNLSTYPENEQQEIKTLAENSLVNGGMFLYNTVQYQAKMEENELKIYFVVPRKPKVNVTYHLTAEEKSELISLGRAKLQEANSTVVTVEYKNIRYDIKSIGENKILLSLASGSVIPPSD